MALLSTLTPEISSLVSALEPSLRPETLDEAFQNSLSTILNNPQTSNIQFFQLMKSLLQSPSVYTSNPNAINVPNGRGGKIALVLKVIALHGEKLTLCASTASLKILKSWIKESAYVTGSGSFAVLLHLLRSLKSLPISEEGISESGIGRCIGTLKKHEVCRSENGPLLKSLIKELIDTWMETAKRNAGKSGGKKRSSQDISPLSKKAKVAEPPKMSAAEAARARAEERSRKRKQLAAGIKPTETSKTSSDHSTSTSTVVTAESSTSTLTKEITKKSTTKTRTTLQSSPLPSPPTSPKSTSNLKRPGSKKNKKKVSFSSNLTSVRTYEVTISEEEEKELLNKLKNNTLSTKEKMKLDAAAERAMREKQKMKEQEDSESKNNAMKEQIEKLVKNINEQNNFKPFKPLPPTTTEKPVVQSKSKTQIEQKLKSIMPVQYLTKKDIPNNPDPLTKAEEAEQLKQIAQTVTKPIEWGETSGSASSTSTPASAPAPVPQQPMSFDPLPPQPPSQLPPQTHNSFEALPPTPMQQPPPQQQYGGYGGAPPPSLNPSNMPGYGAPPPQLPPQPTGPQIPNNIPRFLHSCDPDVLRTLSMNPSLMEGFKDGGGGYNEPGLLALVATLASTKSGISTQKASFQTQQAPIGAKMASNLHVSGYGPATVRDHIQHLFSQYVQVKNIIFKDGFCFVNTDDPDGVSRARQALQGFMLNGSPMKINDAIKRNADAALPMERETEENLFRMSSEVKDNQTPLPLFPNGDINYSQIFDDKGNGTNTNLWVGGFRSTPTDMELRKLFGPHCQIKNTVIKDQYCFVNTEDLRGAVLARFNCQGDIFKGGVIKINFAGGKGGSSRPQPQQQQMQQQQQQPLGVRVKKSKPLRYAHK
ncbi:hypothetical protein TrLO_g15224 [Triparma laevis f. longispina]|uniref:Uncharacterized protein n=1 Tax=Triparma laevis f. longispina TaxID=1714387 RepID=A0A9W7DWF1_9STRA|nr:hypothetical protein TrLO_g15224 [Triparma laevis f. longispina]